MWSARTALPSSFAPTYLCGRTREPVAQGRGTRRRGPLAIIIVLDVVVSKLLAREMLALSMSTHLGGQGEGRILVVLDMILLWLANLSLHPLANSGDILARRDWRRDRPKPRQQTEPGGRFPVVD
jgi:hypothetical protein